MKKSISLFVLLVMALSCSKEIAMQKTDASSSANEIAIYASINNVCGQDGYWYIHYTLTNSNPDRKYWLVQCADSMGTVLAVLRVYEGDTTVQWTNYQGCVDPANCPWHPPHPVIFLVKGSKPVIGQPMTNTWLAEYDCPYCKPC